jgi:hypothetical protein
MVSSFGVSLALLVLNRKGIVVPTPAALLITVAVTTFCWMLTAFIGPETDRHTLVEFYRKVRPFGPGWRQVRIEAGITEAESRTTHENIPLALLGWLAGCTVIWSGLFMVGNFLYGRMVLGWILLATFLISGMALIGVINRLWSGIDEKPDSSKLVASPDTALK